ncbi:MAG: hypothetical protein AAGK00_07680 [Pseudomonadota bacterium]
MSGVLTRREHRQLRAIALLLTGLFLAKAAAVVLFLLPYASISPRWELLTWLGQNYDVRVGLLVVTGVALYGTVIAIGLASLRARSAAHPAQTQPPALHAVKTEQRPAPMPLPAIAAE